MKRASLLFAFAVASAVSACATKVPYDYAAFSAHMPRSILVLPPVNASADVQATYGYLTTVTWPLAEKGYYVFPVMLIDEYMKENGLQSANDMQQVPLSKIHDIIGADAVLYVKISEYGTKYQLLNSMTEVAVEGKLVDVNTGITLWEGQARVAQNSNGGSGGADPLATLITSAVTALVDQVANTVTDHAHKVSRVANAQLFMSKDNGLLDGPYLAK